MSAFFLHEQEAACFAFSFFPTSLVFFSEELFLFFDKYKQPASSYFIYNIRTRLP
jgi:hypothetical protein